MSESRSELKSERTAELISVIIPVYNVEGVLAETLDSVLGQTHRELEVICIDDGSTDGSRALLEQYAAQDARIRVLTQPNAGAGAARNRGLDAAQGAYLSFLDADDTFEPEMLALAYQRCKRYDADFCLFDSDEFGVERWRTAGPATINKKLLPLEQPVFDFRAIKGDVFRSMLGWAWDKLYKTAFVRAHDLRFPEQHNTEDLYFVFAGLVLAERITVLDKTLVHQRIRPSTSLSKSRARHPFDFYASLTALRDLLKREGSFQELESDYVNYALHYSLWSLNNLPGEAFGELYDRLKTDIFANLGIADKPEEFFYNKRDFERFRFIREYDPFSYLQEQKREVTEQLRSLIRKVPFGLGVRIFERLRYRY
ncbi:MAG: glycosyltransferase family 2 protein [Coriobacteriales bacterium]|jgi:glycosyltransferase involved in cell wall biosynthesis|nr:glycosyltransferase family 2 protein [Coriobacteriales bacterium]